MKKRVMAMMMAGVLSAGLLAGCQKEPAAQETPEAVEEENGNEEEEAGEEEPMANMINPWRDCTEEEAKEACPRLFKIPDGAEVLGWSILDDATDAFGVSQSLVEAGFQMDDLVFNARALYGAPEDTDISGMYYDWSDGMDVTLANWGEGHMQGKLYSAETETGVVELLTWYDVEIGIAYSLSVAAEDLDGFDLQAIAEMMYDPANEPMTGGLLRDDPAEAGVVVLQALQKEFEHIYGDDVNDARFDLTIYDSEAIAEGDVPLDELLMLNDEDIPFEVSFELHPAEDADINMLTVPDGVYDEESGWIKEMHRLGVARPGADGEYMITNFGTGW